MFSAVILSAVETRKGGGAIDGKTAINAFDSFCGRLHRHLCSTVKPLLSTAPLSRARVFLIPTSFFARISCRRSLARPKDASRALSRARLDEPHGPKLSSARRSNSCGARSWLRRTRVRFRISPRGKMRTILAWKPLYWFLSKTSYIRGSHRLFLLYSRTTYMHVHCVMK